MMRPSLLFSFIVSFFARYAPAQSSDTSLVGNTIQELTSFWNAYVPKQFVSNDSSSIREVREFLNTAAFVANAGASNLSGKIEENRLRAAILRTDWGLKFSSGYMENFNPSFNDEDNLLYNRRIQAGVNWDILNSGLVENRALAKAEELENLILQSAFLKGNRTEDLTVKWNQVIYLFNLQKIKILEERLLLVQKQHKAAQSLFLSRYLTKEMLLENEKRLAEIKSMQQVYVDFNKQIEALGIKPSKELDFPLIDLRYDKLFAAPSHSDAQVNDSLMHLLMEKNTLKNKYLNEVNLGTFVRYNYYNLITIDPASRSFMSAGINLSLPIYFRGKLRQQYIAQQSVNEYNALTSQNETEKANLLDDVYEFRYKLKQYIVFYQKKLVFAELLRRENARRSIDPVSFNPYKVISLQDDLLSIDIELTELRQNMYLKLLMIYLRKNHQGMDQAYECMLLPDRISYVDPVRKSIYAWSSTFEKYDTAFIAEYVRFHDIRSFAVSQGNKAALLPAIRSTVRRLKKEGVEIELLAGDNQFVNKKPEDYFNANGLSVADVSVLHIDYEPHTFSDWDQRKSSYMQGYIQALQKAREFCDKNGLKLRIDLPLHYDEKDVRDLMALCDQVCFMAYENVKTSYISAKLGQYVDTIAKISIALRTNDFNTRAEMEAKMDELSQVTGVTSFYLHDLGRCIAFDEKAVEKK